MDKLRDCDTGHGRTMKEVYMDFGDILEQWEASTNKKTKDQNKPRKRLPNAPRLQREEKGLAIEDQLPEEECETRKTYQSAEKRHPMHIWLRRSGVIDKDSLAEAVEEQEKSQDREHLKKMPIGAKIDLHGLTREEAWSRLDGFIRECSRRNIKKVLIVHGKGNHCENQVSVLSSMVRTFIEVDDRLGTSGHPDKKLGGTGATWVIIKK